MVLMALLLSLLHYELTEFLYPSLNLLLIKLEQMKLAVTLGLCCCHVG